MKEKILNPDLGLSRWAVVALSESAMCGDFRMLQDRTAADYLYFVPNLPRSYMGFLF